jgi:signal transduction histidine kinase
MAAWENDGMSFGITSLRSARAKATFIVVLVVVLAVLNLIASPSAVLLHNILHHLNILPLMLAGMLFGWRGAVKTILLAAVLMSPAIYRHWFHAPEDAQDQIVELTTFGAAGIIAGVLADRERSQRLRVETTKLELERVYTELQQNIDHLKRTERLTAAGQLSASLAHEIRNPLASISGAAGILARGQASNESRAECLDILTKESQRLNKLLTNFLEFARPRLPRYQRVDPEEMVRSVAVLAQHTTNGLKVQMELAPQQRELECDAEQIKQLLLNLVLNAAQANDEKEVVRIRSFFAEDSYYIEVSDRGQGISSEVQESIFEPFFTTKETGTGLGLAIAANIAAQHGGALTFESTVAVGTTFRLQLPLVRKTTMKRVEALR